MLQTRPRQGGTFPSYTFHFSDQFSPSIHTFTCLTEPLLSHPYLLPSSTCRRAIEERVAREPGLHLLFLESVCDDPAVIAANIALKVSSGDPDYKNMSKADAEADFKNRIAQYEAVYEPVSEPHLSYCKVINVGRTVHINKIGGYLESRVAYYLMNLHLKPRAIFLSRVSRDFRPFFD
jgi:hypothetical protein